MKQIITLLLLAIGLSANAQSTSPRYHNPPGGDNSANTVSFYLKTIADTAGSTSDTIEMRPAYQTTNYKLTLTDSCYLRLKSLAGSYFNDIVTVDLTKGSGSGLLILDANFVVATGTNRISITASKKTMLTFRFDGSKFVEQGRNANY